MKKISRFECGDMLVNYYQNPTGGIEWLIVPKKKGEDIRLPLKKKFDSLIQVKLLGDDYPKGFVTGSSMRNSETVQSLEYVDQTVTKEVQLIEIATKMCDKHGNHYTHFARWKKDSTVIETWVQFRSRSNSVQTLELLDSFSLSNLSPFGKQNQPGNLWMTRYRSKWSMEGKKEKRPIEALELEPSWKPSGAGIEKFGQVGSMPVRGYFPELFLTDEKEEVTWGVQLCQPGSWQLLAYRLDEDLCLSGGLADYDFGHWTKTVGKGESFTTAKAYLTVGIGDESTVSQRLTVYQRMSLAKRNHPLESELPIVFNEFCTTWGKPSEASILADLKALRGRKITYYVIDAGWYADEIKGWEKNVGDWKVNNQQFPNGLASVIQQIRAEGMVLGIWFEMETVGRDAVAFKESTHQLKRGGIPITTGDRRFWDMRDPWVQEYLTKKMIDFLKNNGIGYLKIDYNDNFGVGFDGKESVGEESRQALEATLAFFDKIQAQLPDLIIENCSSGGHRLAVPFLERSDVSSFSDAHEANCIPIIAANMHELILPQQSLIWAVIRESDSFSRITYTMNATFLGRMCLSGDIHHLSKEQWQCIDEGVAFYQKIMPLIREGSSKRYGNPVLSYRNPVGNQAVVRYGENKEEAFVTIYHFTGENELSIPLNENYQIVATYGHCQQISVNKDTCYVKFEEDFQAITILLKKEDTSK
ncbi:MAG TPA: alpha-galactosidase [Candidatus Tetragenococcus pullicola]|nr:alpha-galactosidase [Candidatus Tetragenococcus pullicola]